MDFISTIITFEILNMLTCQATKSDLFDIELTSTWFVYFPAKVKVILLSGMSRGQSFVYRKEKKNKCEIQSLPLCEIMQFVVCRISYDSMFHFCSFVPE